MRRPRLTGGVAMGLLVVILFLLPVLYAVMLAFELPHALPEFPTDPGHAAPRQLQRRPVPGQPGHRTAQHGALLGHRRGAVHRARPAHCVPIARRLVRGHSALYTLLFIGLFLPFSVIPLFA